MPWIRRLRQVVGTLSVAMAAGLVAWACPYCPPTDPTFSEKLAEADIACLARFLSSIDGEELSMQKTTLQILRLMKPSDDFKVGAQIEIPIGVTGKEGDTFLLFGQKKEGEIEWSLPTEMNEEIIAYVDQAPAPEARANSARLVYFLNCLGNADTTISNDAFSEFARAKLEEVQEMIDQLPEQSDRKLSRARVRARLRKWISDTSAGVDVRRGFYGMLLGMCGTADDARFLEQIVFAPISPDKNRFWIEGVMAGYLMLTGEQGLNKVVEQKIAAVPNDLEPSDPRLSEMNAVRGTLTFLWDYRRPQFSEESLRSIMRRFLDRPETAELAIVNLARWKDWASLEPLSKAYGKSPWETPSGKAKIIAFALACRKDAPSGTDEKLPPHAVKAQAFLDSLDRGLVESVKRSLGGLTPASQSPTEASRTNKANN